MNLVHLAPAIWRSMCMQHGGRPVAQSKRSVLVTFLAATCFVIFAGSVQSADQITLGTTVEGKVSWYGKKFTGRTTASGETFNHNAMTMAHPSWPFGTKVRVTNPANNKSIILRINDRGPTIADRIADVSSGAAQQLDMIKIGVAPLRLEVIELAAPKKRRKK